jgi:hypothetical protein
MITFLIHLSCGHYPLHFHRPTLIMGLSHKFPATKFKLNDDLGGKQTYDWRSYVERPRIL